MDPDSLVSSQISNYYYDRIEDLLPEKKLVQKVPKVPKND